MKTIKSSYILLVSLITVSTIIVSFLFGCNADVAPQVKNKPDFVDFPHYKRAYFAGGCFWCVESNYEKVYGVIEVISGYSGGYVTNPTYRQVSSGKTGHVEAVEVIYDPEKVNYNKLLNELWYLIDPTDDDGSFSDRGKEYRSVIFYTSEEEKIMAEKSIKKLEQSERYSKPIVTEVRPFSIFYKAGEIHQDYYKKNPLRYNYYRFRSGRDRYLEKTWGNDLYKR